MKKKLKHQKTDKTFLEELREIADAYEEAGLKSISGELYELFNKHEYYLTRNALQWYKSAKDLKVGDRVRTKVPVYCEVGEVKYISGEEVLLESDDNGLVVCDKDELFKIEVPDEKK